MAWLIGTHMWLAAVSRHDNKATSASDASKQGEADTDRRGGGGGGGGGREAAAATVKAFLPMAMPSKDLRAATLARVREQLRERERARVRAKMTASSVPTPDSSPESAFP